MKSQLEVCTCVALHGSVLPDRWLVQSLSTFKGELHCVQRQSQVPDHWNQLSTDLHFMKCSLNWQRAQAKPWQWFHLCKCNVGVLPHLQKTPCYLVTVPSYQELGDTRGEGASPSSVMYTAEMMLLKEAYSILTVCILVPWSSATRSYHQSSLLSTQVPSIFHSLIEMTMVLSPFSLYFAISRWRKSKKNRFSLFLLRVYIHMWGHVCAGVHA